ncbi:MAG: 4-hydroxy-3-methylbut-2-enyl diphosphate reductase [Sphingomonadales bacterium]
MTAAKPQLKILLAAPRGFCAGVDRAIKIVELALEKYGAPVYVRHEIVHNRHVVESLEERGAIFVEELDEVPDDVPVVFSAHGVPKTVPAEAERRKLFYLDATCPLVSKVHREAERHFKEGRHILMIGHEGHPEVIGTLGQLPKGAITLIETPEDAANVSVDDPDNLSFISLSTLSVDDTSAVISVLQDRFPNIAGPKREDICYATTNRQEAVKLIAEQCQLVLVVGAANSSNSVRLVEVASKIGTKGQLVANHEMIDWSLFEGVSAVGITAGASAPEILVREVLDAIAQRYDIEIEEVETTRESVTFKLPRAISKDSKTPVMTPA